MSTLDNPARIPDPSDVPFFQTALRYGGITGLISVVLGLAFYVAGITDPTQQGGTGNTIASIINYGILIGGIVMAIKYHKENELGGYLKLGRSLGLGTVIGIIIGIIGAIYTVIFFTFIDPDALIAIKEIAMEDAIEKGAPEDQVEGMISFFTSTTFFAIVIVIGGAFIGFIVSLIAGAIMKKDPPPFA